MAAVAALIIQAQSAGSIGRRTSARRTSVTSDACDHVAASASALKQQFWVPSCAVAELTVLDLDEARCRARAAIGADVGLHMIRCTRANASKLHLVGVSSGDRLIGLYELTDYAGGTLLKRAPDGFVRELLRQFGQLPSGAPRHYEPINAFAGSVRSPSGCAVDAVLGVH